MPPLSSGDYSGDRCHLTERATLSDGPRCWWPMAGYLLWTLARLAGLRVDLRGLAFFVALFFPEEPAGAGAWTLLPIRGVGNLVLSSMAGLASLGHFMATKPSSLGDTMKLPRSFSPLSSIP
jgi:hypothetical protein